MLKFFLILIACAITAFITLLVMMLLMEEKSLLWGLLITTVVIIMTFAGNYYVVNGDKVSEKETYQIATITNDGETFWYADAEGNTKSVNLGRDKKVEFLSEGEPRIEVITDKYARFGIKEVRYAIRVPD